MIGILNPNCEARLNLKDIFTHPYIMNYFLATLNNKITIFFHFFDNCLKQKKFIFVKYYSSNKKKNKSLCENSSLFEEMDISANKLSRTKNSNTNILNFGNSYKQSKAENFVDKINENKVLNLKRNRFFYKIKSEFLTILKNNSKYSLEKENSVVNFNASKDDKWMIKSPIFLEEKLIVKINTDENLDTNKSIHSNNEINLNGLIYKTGTRDSKIKLLLVNKNSEFLEEVLDKIQNKRTCKNDSLDFENSESFVKRDISQSKNNSFKKKVIKKDIKKYN